MIRRRAFSLLRKQISCQSACVRHNSKEEHLPSINVNLLSQSEDGNIYIQGYNQLGFKLKKGIMIMGPCVFFGQTVLHWNVSGPHDIDENALSLFTMLEPKLDMLILGVGSDSRNVNHKLRTYLRSHEIKNEVLTTPQAIELFNFVNSEDRFVAAALLPPEKMLSGIRKEKTTAHDIQLDLKYGLNEYLKTDEGDLLTERMVMKKIHEGLKVPDEDKLDDSERDTDVKNDKAEKKS